MSAARPLLRLHDLDLLLEEARERGVGSRLRRLGLEPRDATPLARARTLLLGSVEPRWLALYERALQRYGRGLAVVRERVCQGCFVTLPTSAAPRGGDSLTVCESCGRLLYWR